MHDSGGLVAIHEEFTKHYIDTEAINNSGLLTAFKAFKIF
jgi:hypothetical protein